MALWQYSFWVIPKSALLGKYEKLPASITEDDFNETEWFADFNQAKNLIEAINYLPVSEHWDKETVFFGVYDKDSISIMFDGNKLVEIKMRVDLRNQNLPILNRMVQSLFEFDLMVVDDGLSIVDPASDDFIEKINIEISDKNNISRRFASPV